MGQVVRMVGVLGLAALAAGCSWFTQQLPNEPAGTWRIEPVGYYVANEVSYRYPDGVWGCIGGFRGRGSLWLVMEIRFTNQRLASAALDEHDTLDYGHPDRAGGSGEYSRHYSGLFYRSVYDQDPYPRGVPKAGYAYFSILPEYAPAAGQPLVGRLEFRGDALSDAKGQAEAIDLVGLPPVSPPADAPTQCH